LKTGPAFFIALRYLLGRAREGGRYLRGAAAGIALSLIPIVVTLIVADGMIRGIMDRFLELGSGHLRIYDWHNSADPFAEPVMASILNFPGIRGAWLERQGIAVIYGPSGSKGATVRSVEESFWDDEGSRKFLQTLSGEANLENSRDVLLGEELARTIGATVGSTVRIMTTHLSPAGTTIPRVAVFTVRGIVSSGYRELDSLWCLMNLEAGRRTLPESNAAYLILKIDDPYNGADSMARSLRDLLGSGFGVFTWKSIHSSQYSSYESTRQLLLFIMALIVLVAAVNVSFATSMLAIERQRDIAILKNSGASPTFTSGVFLWGAFLTGVVGSVLGIAAGLALGALVNTLIRALETVLSFFSGLFHAGPVTILDSAYYLETIPIIVNWQVIVVIFFFTVLSSVLASWFPARRAGKLKPIEILRKY
jgi:lipoprotein-releasing system permease protein